MKSFLAILIIVSSTASISVPLNIQNDPIALLTTIDVIESPDCSADSNDVYECRISTGMIDYLSLS